VARDGASLEPEDPCVLRREPFGLALDASQRSPRRRSREGSRRERLICGQRRQRANVTTVLGFR
jgi:hypothetical protein